MKTFKKLVKVETDKSVTLKSLPFKPGSKVEVIVLPAEERKDVFGFMDHVVKKKKIAPLSMKRLEKIVHDARAGKSKSM